MPSTKIVTSAYGCVLLLLYGYLQWLFMLPSSASHYGEIGTGRKLLFNGFWFAFFHIWLYER
jgi:hypothetical protein